MKTKLILLVAFLTSMATFSQKQWTLKECVDQALEKNISIQQNKLSLELAKKDVEIAKGNFLPNLNGSSSGRFGFGSIIDNISNARISTNNFNASVDLNSNVTVFNGFRNIYKCLKTWGNISKPIYKIRYRIFLWNVKTSYL